MNRPIKRLETYAFPDERGYFGFYGGRFVPETLIPALDELETIYREARSCRP